MQMTENVVLDVQLPDAAPCGGPSGAGQQLRANGRNYGNYLPQNWFQGDYSANAGTVQIGWWGPDTWTQAASTRRTPVAGSRSSRCARSTASASSGARSRSADITDGTSCTYLVGEKYMDVDEYYTGQRLGRRPILRHRRQRRSKPLDGQRLVFLRPAC